MMGNEVEEMQKNMPVQVCYGPEKYLLQEYLSRTVSELVEPELREFAVSRYDLAETPLDEVLDDAETAPFMAPRKVIIAKNALFLTGARDTGKVEHRVERLLDYLKAPAEESIILFTVDADKLDERKKVVKALKEKKCLMTFPSMSSEELAKWTERRAEKMEFSFSPGTVEEFVLFTGGQLQSMVTEMEKLSLYVGRSGVVTRELVDRLVVRSTEQNVFILIEDIVRRRMDRAFEILYELLKQKEEPVKLAMLMARQFRIILQVKELSGQGYSQQQIASQIGLHPYPVKIASEQGRAYSPEKLKEILAALADLDFRIKSGQIEKVLGLELALLQISA